MKSIDCSNCALDPTTCHDTIGLCDFDSDKFVAKEEVDATGSKYDAGLTDMSYMEYFPLAFEAICKQSMFGADKGYARGSFADVPNAVPRYTAAMWRHYFKEGPLNDEKRVDPQSGLPHDFATAWNAVCRLELRLRELNKIIR